MKKHTNKWGEHNKKEYRDEIKALKAGKNVFVEKPLCIN